MRWLIADTVYPAFLRSLYNARSAPPRMSHADPYRQQLQELLRQDFGASDFYSTHLRAAGHEVSDVVLNAEHMQHAWSREFGRPPTGRTNKRRLVSIFKAQVAAVRPDVVYLLDMNWLPDSDLREIATMAGRVVGQVACAFDFKRDLSSYALVISSLPHFVNHFRILNVPAEYIPLAFEPTVLAGLEASERSVDVAFVGSLDEDQHNNGTRLLRTVVEQTSVSIWGPRPRRGVLPSWLAPHYQGEAWGRDMYAVLARSKIVLNRHINVALNSANNLRLFEATGAGACLVTDAKSNLRDLFEPSREVMSYTGADGCAAIVQRLLRDDSLRIGVAEAGQRRTLNQHTYAKRAAVMIELLEQRPARRHACQPAPRSSLSMIRRQAIGLKERLAPMRTGVSTGHTQIAALNDRDPLALGWRSEKIPGRQGLIAEKELAATRRGTPPAVYVVAAEAVRATGLVSPSILEVGCASAYYADALRLLLNEPFEYLGIDYSMPLLQESRRVRPAARVVAGDATRLPLADSSVDIVLSAAVLMHVPDWRRVVEESFRIARRAVILHRTPVFGEQAPIFLRKLAYGVPVVEIVLPEQTLTAQCAHLGGSLAGEWRVENMKIGAAGGGVVEVKTLLFMLSDGTP